MAKIKTRKEIGEELEAVKAEFEQAQTSFSEELNTVNTALVDAQAQVEKLTTDLAEANAGLENAVRERDELAEQVKSAIEAADAAKAETEQAVKVLENPAIQDAVNIVPVEIDQKLEDAEADLAEDEGEEELELTVAEKYESMPAGPERSAFWKQHKRAIIAEYEKA